MAAQNVRLSLELSENANSMLEQVATHNGTTKADVIRRAIALIAYADDVKQQGHRLAVTDRDRKVVADIVAPI